MSLPVDWYDGGQKEKAEYLHSVIQRLARMYYLFIMELYIVVVFYTTMYMYLHLRNTKAHHTQ